MSTSTANLHLIKPELGDNVSLAVINQNYDALDTEVNGRVKTADIVNNLTSTVTNKPLSAAQGKALSDTKLSKTDMPLTASLTNTNARIYTFEDNSGTAYPLNLVRYYGTPTFVTASSGVTLTQCHVETMNNLVIMSLVFTVNTVGGSTTNVLTMSKYIPRSGSYARASICSQSGDGAQIVLNSSGTLTMYNAKANATYRGEIIYIVPTIPAE